MLKPLLLSNCKDLTLKLDVKYIFQTSSSGANLYKYEMPEDLKMRKK